MAIIERIFFGEDGLRSGWKVLIFHIAALFGLVLNGILIGLPIVLMVLYFGLGPESGPVILVSMCSYFGVFLVAMACGRFLDGRLIDSGLGGPAKRSALEFVAGGVAGAALNLGGMVMVWIATFAVADSAVEVQLTSDFRGLIAIPFWFVGLIFAAAFEEVFFRGYGFVWSGRMVGNVVGYTGISPRVAQYLGRVPVVFVSAVFFALLHIGNPGQSGWIPQISTFVAGLWLAAAVYRSGALWFAIGMHWAWNSFMGLILGVRLSGLNVPSVLETTMTGPDWLTGGAYGLEGSVFGMLAFSLGIFVILLLPKRPPEQTMMGLLITPNPDADSSQT